MKLHYVKEKDRYMIYEHEQLLFKITTEKQKGLLTLYLYNVYDECMMGFYQIEKWYHSLIKLDISDFTIYRKDDKLGELHKLDGGFEIAYYGVFYRFYGGLHQQKRQILCLDKEKVCAQLYLDEQKVLFYSRKEQAFFALLLVLFSEYIPFKRCKQAYFQKYYHGVFQEESMQKVIVKKG